MLKIPFIYVKDKQAFKKEEGVLKLIGKPSELAREWKKEGIKLVHIVDLDAINGNNANFDIYDTLTYFINIEVEGARDEKAVAKLIDVNARVIIELPTPIKLSKFSEKKRLLVGKIEKIKDANDDVFDLYYTGTDEKEVVKLLKTKRRIILTSLVKLKGKIKPFGMVKM